MPKSEKVSGIRAATGMLRPKSVIGRNKALTREKHPQSTPRGTPTSVARPKPEHTRRRVVSRLRVRPRSNQRLWKLAKVSQGLDSPFDGEMIRSSGSPRVTNHQSARQPPTPTRPITTTCQRGACSRRPRKMPERKPRAPGRPTLTRGSEPFAIVGFPGDGVGCSGSDLAIRSVLARFREGEALSRDTMFRAKLRHQVSRVHN